MTLALTAEDDSADEESLTAPATLVAVEIGQSALASARGYYSARKAAAVKTAKTVAQAQVAVRQAEKKAAATVQSLQATASIRRVRAPFWWEKFDWFLSSENRLVLLARDLQQAEMLASRHLGPRDVYVHADLSGAPVCVVKHWGGADEDGVPPLTLSQVCRHRGALNAERAATA